MIGRNLRIAMALALSTGAVAMATGSLGGCSSGGSGGVGATAPGAAQEHTGAGRDRVPASARVARIGAGIAELALYDTATAGSPRERISRTGAYGTDRVFLVKRRDGDRVQLYLPSRPNGSTAWADAGDLRLRTVRTRIVVERRRFRLTLYRDGRRVRSLPIGLGSEDGPTPAGLFYVTELLRTPDPGGPYGPYAFGLSGHSEVYRSFGGGDGQLGVHGTNQPELIGKRVSHGCIRLANDAVSRLAAELPLGTPVQIV